MLGLLDKWFNLFSPSFYMMLRNINNKAYLKSFLEQQPVISYYTRVMEYDYDDHSSPTTVARYNFKYGSYEYQLSKIKKNENETVVFLIKEEYVFNEEAQQGFDDFLEAVYDESHKLRNFLEILYDDPDTLLFCFNNGNSKLINFLTSESGLYLYLFLKILNLEVLYQYFFYRQIDSYKEITVKKMISLDKEEYRYKYNENFPDATSLFRRAKPRDSLWRK